MSIEDYNKNPNICQICGNIIPYNKRHNKTCSRSCSVSLSNMHRRHSDETKQKIKNSVIKTKSLQKKQPDERTCIICGNKFIPHTIANGRVSKIKVCSDECLFKLRSQNSKNTYVKLVNENRFIGWQSRNIISYAEQFWINVLDNNNITYIREYHYDKYFLDFLIEYNGQKIDLEIDGKQHNYLDRIEHDKIRDEYLTSNNFIVYRIQWNEISSTNGSLQMKEKIDRFLNFLNTIT